MDPKTKASVRAAILDARPTIPPPPAITPPPVPSASELAKKITKP